MLKKVIIGVASGLLFTIFVLGCIALINSETNDGYIKVGFVSQEVRDDKYVTVLKVYDTSEIIVVEDPVFYGVMKIEVEQKGEGYTFGFYNNEEEKKIRYTYLDDWWSYKNVNSDGEIK